MRVFLGGTCNESPWRDRLTSMLNCEYFNPVVDDWNEEAQQRELRERVGCDVCLYAITPWMTGVYSIAEVTDDSNKRPQKTVFVLLRVDGDLHFDAGQWKSLRAVARLVKSNGSYVFENLVDAAKFLNVLHRKEQDNGD